ncbi:MAG: hypothetical protein ACM3QU_03200 [Verrucomicrobiota bacterium]
MDPPPPRLRFLFFMLHAGYLRFYRPAIEVLAARGHEVHLAFTRLEKDRGDSALAAAIAEANPGVTYEEAPVRRRDDGWRPLSALVRSLVDLGRYMNPRYEDAPALRARMATKLTRHVSTAGRVDPVSARVTLRAVRFLEQHSGEAWERRVVGSLGAVEQAIPTAPEIDRYLRDRRPDAVLVTPVIEFASSQVEYLKSARRAGIPAAVCVASWDNLTGKGLIRVVPDRVLVWNDMQVEEAVSMHGIPRERVVTTGAAKFDEWFERRPSSGREDFLRQVGLADRPFVLYACSSAFIAPDEVSFVERWLGALRAHRGLEDVGVLVRPHPQNARQWDGVDLSRFGNVVVWPAGGAQPDAGEARAGFFDSLWHGAAVVGINTSALIEAAILGKSVLTPRVPEFAGTQEGTLHFRYVTVENGGFVHAGELDEHLDALADVLARGDEHAERTRRFVESFVRPHGIDRSAAPIMADAIEGVASLSPAPVRSSPGTELLRIALTPAAFAVGVIGGVSARLRRRPPAERDLA